MNRETIDVINKLKEHQNLDYSSVECKKAIDEAVDSMLHGNWDVTTDISIDGVRELRFIQEDEWDQHMDHDDGKPTWEKMLFSFGLGYVWFADDTQ